MNNSILYSNVIYDVCLNKFNDQIKINGYAVHILTSYNAYIGSVNDIFYQHVFKKVHIFYSIPNQFLIKIK